MWHVVFLLTMMMVIVSVALSLIISSHNYKYALFAGKHGQNRYIAAAGVRLHSGLIQVMSTVMID